MSTPFLGEIRAFGFNFAPRGWAMCNGQILSIAQNTALFSLLGTTYGGNGVSTFALPNLQSRVPLHFGQGLGLSAYVLGEASGTESVTLLSNQMPQHTHLANSSVNALATTDSPSGAVWAKAGLASDGSAVNAYSTNPVDSVLAPTAIGLAGGSQPHDNLQPYLALNFCIATEGIFPSRN